MANPTTRGGTTVPPNPPPTDATPAMRQRWVDFRDNAGALAQTLFAYAALGVALFLVLFVVIGLNAFMFLLLLGGLLVAVGDRRTWTIPESVARHKWNPFGLELNLGYVGFGLLLIPLVAGALNVFGCLLFDAEPLYPIAVVLLFMVLVSYRFVENWRVLVVGACIALAVLAVTKLAEEPVVAEGIQFLIDHLPDGLVLIAELLLIAVLIGLLRGWLRLNWPARLFLTVLVLTLALELFALSADFSLTGVAGDLQCVAEQTDDPFPSNDQATEVLGQTGLCDKDGPDWATALIRLLGIITIAVVMFGPQRQSVVKKTIHDDDLTWFELILEQEGERQVLTKDQQKILTKERPRIVSLRPDLKERLDRDGFVEDYVEWREEEVLRRLREAHQGERVTTKDGRTFRKDRLKALFGNKRGVELVEVILGLTPADL